jgi:hypothetical protein
MGFGRMDEILEAIQAEVTEDPPRIEVEAFFRLLKALEETLHEHTKVTLLVFITWLMAIKSKYFFSNSCYNDLMKLINDILLKTHKMPKDMYQSKKLMSALSMKYDKIDVCPDNCMFFLERECQREQVLRVWSINVCRSYDLGQREGDNRSRTKAASLHSYHTSFKVVIYL